MKNLLTFNCIFFATIVISGCSVFGSNTVDIAPYTVLKKNDQFELRYYNELVLVSTPIKGIDGQRGSFGKLFDYISGENRKIAKISMTAPVFLNQQAEQSETMSFVLPSDYSYETAPIPSDPSVKLEHITNYTVATITFNGKLKQTSIEKNKKLLQNWIKESNLKVIGKAKAAGYNPPFTLSAFRRNEILIPVERF